MPYHTHERPTLTEFGETQYLSAKKQWLKAVPVAMVDLSVMKCKLIWITINEKLVSILKDTASRFKRVWDPMIHCLQPSTKWWAWQWPGGPLDRPWLFPFTFFFFSSSLPSSSILLFSICRTIIQWQWYPFFFTDCNFNNFFLTECVLWNRGIPSCSNGISH